MADYHYKKYTTPLSPLFLHHFSIIKGNQIGAKGKHININLALNQAQEASTLNIKLGIQIATESLQLQYRNRYAKDSETRRKAWYSDLMVVVRLNGGW